MSHHHKHRSHHGNRDDVRRTPPPAPRPLPQLTTIEHGDVLGSPARQLPTLPDTTPQEGGDNMEGKGRRKRRKSSSPRKKKNRSSVQANVEMTPNNKLYAPSVIRLYFGIPNVVTHFGHELSGVSREQFNVDMVNICSKLPSVQHVQGGQNKLTSTDIGNVIPVGHNDPFSLLYYLIQETKDCHPAEMNRNPYDSLKFELRKLKERGGRDPIYKPKDKCIISCQVPDNYAKDSGRPVSGRSNAVTPSGMVITQNSGIDLNKVDPEAQKPATSTASKYRELPVKRWIFFSILASILYSLIALILIGTLASWSWSPIALLVFVAALATCYIIYWGEKTRPGSDQLVMTMEECIDTFLNKEKNSNNNENYFQDVKFSTFPEYLIVYLQLLNKDGNGVLQKTEVPVLAADELDLQPWRCPDSWISGTAQSSTTNLERNKTRYRLMGLISCGVGETEGSHQHNCYLKQGNDWLYCNEDVTKKTSKPNIGEGYMFLYKRQ